MIRDLRDDLLLDAAARASAVAGPIFCTSFAAATLYLQLPKPIIITAGEVLGFFYMLLPAMIVGAILAILPNVIGTWALMELSKSVEAARRPFVWWLTGGVCGGAIALAFDVGIPAIAFALIATATASAALCRARLGT